MFLRGMLFVSQSLFLMGILLSSGVCPASTNLGFDVERTILPNGLTILTCVDTTASTVSYQTFINAGSRDETKAGATGIAHVFEHMMFRGTEKYPSFSDAVAPMGAQTNAYTSEDYTCYYVNAKAGFLDRIIEIESDRVRNLRFTRDAFRRELGPVREERRRGVDDNPDGYLYQELYRLAFRKHTYHHPVIGWERDLEKTLRYEDAYAFKRIFYAPNYCTIVICGNFDPDKAGEWILEHYGDWKQSLPPTSRVRNEPVQKKPRRRDLEFKDTHTPNKILIGYKAPDLNLDSPDLVALQVLDNILFSRTGRLYRKLKLELDFVQSVRGEIDGRKDPCLFVIDATLKPDIEFDSVVAVVKSEIATLAVQPVSEAELTRAVNPMKSRFLRRLSTPFRVGGMLGYYHLVGGDYRMLFQYYDMLGTISAGDVRNAVETYLTPSNSTIVTLSPLSEN
jgi:zinc protease